MIGWGIFKSKEIEVKFYLFLITNNIFVPDGTRGIFKFQKIDVNLVKNGLQSIRYEILEIHHKSINYNGMC